MNLYKDDIRRREDGSIDYDLYKRAAAEFRLEERDRFFRALFGGAFRLVRETAAAAVRAVLAPGKAGDARH